jgi:hypothetical protein
MWNLLKKIPEHMIHKVFDTMGFAGFILLTIASWFSELEFYGKLIGISGGVLLMILSLIHKSLQIRNEKRKAADKELIKELQTEIQKLKDGTN